MSLQRQLLFAVTGLFLLLLLGNLVVSVLNTRSYLQDQLQVHAQDAATSLGFSVSQAAKNQDRATIEAMINAIFDRGYYRRIAYQGLSGADVVAREYPVVIEGVPSWFIHWLDLPEPVGSAEVVSGWYQLGSMVVVGHPGFAYRDLWRVFKEQVWLFFAMAALCYIAAAIALRYLLEPLRRVEQQAEAICSRDFSPQLQLPKTTELRRVVVAMNRMVHKVADMFQEQLLLSEGLFRQAHIDPVTNLSNRADFDARMHSFLSAEHHGCAGALLLIHLDSLHKLNRREGRASGDLCLQSVAAVLQQRVTQEQAVLARRSGADFCVFIPFIALSDAQALTQSILESIESLEWFKQVDGADCLIGATYSDAVVAPQSLLEQADTALRQAQHEGASGLNWYIAETVHDISRSGDDWRRLLQDKAARRELTFDVQPVFGREKTLLHLEVLARLEFGGERRPAATFIAMAERLNLTPTYDRLLLEQVYHKFETISSPQLCINLSVLSIKDAGFQQWLETFLTDAPVFATRLIFELNERAIHVAEPDVRKFITRVRALGCAVALDHVGLNGAALHYLQSLGVMYLKVARRFTQDLEQNADNQFYVRSLVHIAHSCDALLLAEGVETEAGWNAALALGFDGGQGFALGKPQLEWIEGR